MIHRKIGRLRLQLYDSIDELPIERYHKFNMYCLMYLGIGNDPASISKHYTDMIQSIAKNDIDRLKTQLHNYYTCLHLITQGVDTQTLAFSCLVYSINEKEITDTSEEGLNWIRSRVVRAEKRSTALQILADLKKKLKANLKYIFQRG